MIKRFLLGLFVVAGLCFNVAFAAQQEEIEFHEYISDKAYVFSDQAAENLNKTIKSLHVKTGSEILVVTFQALDKNLLDSYLNKIETLRKGDLEAKHSALLIYSKKDNYLQLFLDEWFAGKVEPNTLKQLGDNDILPYFESGEYDKGLARGVYSLTDLIAELNGITVEHIGIVPPAKQGKTIWWLWLFLIPLIAGAGATVWILVASKNNKKED